MSRSVKLRERDIEKTCSDFLSLDGWRMLKTDPVSNRALGKGFGEKGMADCLYIRYRPWLVEVHVGQKKPGDDPWMKVVTTQAEVIWCEYKSPRGRAGPHQLAWHEAERARGALTLIAGQDFEASIEGLMGWYRSSGLMRRNI